MSGMGQEIRCELELLAGSFVRENEIRRVMQILKRGRGVGMKRRMEKVDWMKRH